MFSLEVSIHCGREQLTWGGGRREKGREGGEERGIRRERGGGGSRGRRDKEGGEREGEGRWRGGERDGNGRGRGSRERDCYYNVAIILSQWRH